ncbi:hypothetical protein CLTEP_02370 [Clostridium tepidiprofundi DSM 19306]|uniref:Uncharacterized protein n=1 Tax=Clostridium tepidiprofundi DSM 19306 TaxID=1121338 RepID=A0A151B7I1_9CLOT|nr:hypothetical protein [Clostridium tepidiprofundi]KYH35844.1 hypothetical protein CLTEP_02370 [Clostridium tepidiprofundi DSM 19306]
MDIIDNIKTVVKTLQQMDNLELNRQIIDIETKVMELIEENKEIKRCNEELREKLKIKENLEFENNMYWIKEKDKTIGPFCTRCWDNEKKLLRLHKKDDGWGTIYMECPECITKIVIEKRSIKIEL